MVGTEHGVICDLNLNNSSQLTWDLAPPAIGSCEETTVTTSISYRITNLDSPQAVTVTFTYLTVET
jgi:hypothetical protein